MTARGQDLPGRRPGKEFSLLFSARGPGISMSHTGTVLGSPKVQGSEGRGRGQKKA